MLESGMSKKSISRVLNIDRRDITLWERRYQRSGTQGLENKPHRTFTPEFRQQVADEYLQGKSTMRQLAVERELAISTLKVWVRARRKSLEQENLINK